VKTPFRFPASLSSRHVEELEKRAISREFALQSGVRTAADNELRELNFQASLPLDERRKGLQGICFAYRDPQTNEEVSWRIKPDTPFVMGDGKPAKYLSRMGDKPRAYLPHTVTADMLADAKVNAIITEGEFKALAIAEATAKAAPDRRMMVIGLQGVNGGWQRDKVTVPTPDGGHEKKPTGPPHLIEDLEKIEWRKRRVYIVFDSDVGSRKQAALFKQNKHAGSWGAEHVLAELLRARGADVRIVIIPEPDGDAKVGADDYIAAHGPYEFLKLLWNNWVASRDADEVLHRPQPESYVFVEAREMVRAKPARPPFVIERLLPEAGTCMIAAAPKVGKSGLALNAALAVVKGDPFLGIFKTRPGRAVYIQTEIPAWAMSDRLGLMGALPEGLLIWNPGRFSLNLWEEDGFNKRRETGNRERVAGLIQALKAHGVSLVVFDPLRHFHTLSELKVEHVAHMFEIFRAIGRAVPCGVLIVHHHRKTSRSVVQYEGAEDMSGSGALFAEADSIVSIYAKTTRSDNTRRLKVVFETRHSETPEPLELLRMGGDNAMLYEAQPWTDATSVGSDEEMDRILEILEQGPKTAEQVAEVIRRHRVSAGRKLNRLIALNKVEKVGRVYYLRPGIARDENG